MFKIKDDENLMAFLAYDHSSASDIFGRKWTRIHNVVLFAGLIIVLQIIILWCYSGDGDYGIFYNQPEHITNARETIQLYARISGVIAILLVFAISMVTISLFRSDREYSSFASEVTAWGLGPVSSLMLTWMFLTDIYYEPYIPTNKMTFILSIFVWLFVSAIGAIISTFVYRRLICKGYYIGGFDYKKAVRRKYTLIIPITFIGAPILRLMVEMVGLKYIPCLIVIGFFPIGITRGLMKWHYAKRFGHTEIFTNEEYDNRREENLLKYFGPEE